MLLYRKLNVENFEFIQTELEYATKDAVLDNKRFWDVDTNWIETNAPTLYSFLSSRVKIPIRLCRFYLTPEFGSLKPHVDGLTNTRSPIGLNIPISGCENTTMSWYKCPEDNFIDGPFGFGGITASKVVNPGKLSFIESTTINCPTFVRTDVVHGVTNMNPTHRLVLSIRFFYGATIGQNFDDVFNLTGL